MVAVSMETGTTENQTTCYLTRTVRDVPLIGTQAPDQLEHSAWEPQLWNEGGTRGRDRVGDQEDIKGYIR